MNLKSTGIKIAHHPERGWSAEIEYMTPALGLESCIDGSVRTRYFMPDLSQAIDLVMSAARSIGVTFFDHEAIPPAIYVEGDGEDEKVSLPENWRALVAEQCERLGWKSIYTTTPTAQPEAPRG